MNFTFRLSYFRLPLLALVAFGACNPGPAMAQKSSEGDALKAATDKAREIEKMTGASPGAAKLPGGDPCTIVSAKEVRKVFPEGKGSERSRRLEQYGITECVWKGSKGQILLGIQESFGDSETSAKDEALGMAQGFADPMKRESLKNVRIEKFNSLGIDNAAFVETSDPARGILSDGAFMALSRGRHVVTLISADLARRDRRDALKQFEVLGREAASRLR